MAKKKAGKKVARRKVQAAKQPRTSPKKSMKKAAKKAASRTKAKAVRKPARSQARAKATAPARKKARKAPTTRKAPAKKVAARKAPVKKAAARKAPASKVAARKAPARTAPVKKAPVKKAPAAKAAAPRTRPAAKVPAAPVVREARGLQRERKRLADVEAVAFTGVGADDRMLRAARAGHDELRSELLKHNESSPELTAGDVDAKWQDAYAVGDEAPGGDNPTPDQDRVDDIGKALGVEYDDDEELRGGEEIAERDERRWELDPASKEDEEI